MKCFCVCACACVCACMCIWSFFYRWFFFFSASVHEDFCIVFTGQASAFQGSTSIVGDPVKGSTITVQCSWSLAVDESLLQLSIGTPPINNDANTYYFTIFTGNSQSPITGNQYHNRLSLVGMNISSGSVSMNISGLQCSDEQNYTCQFSYSKSSQINRSSDPKMLNVRGKYLHNIFLCFVIMNSTK